MAVTHVVCVVSGGLNVHGVAAEALVGASDAAPSRTGEIAQDRYASNFDRTDMCVASLRVRSSSALSPTKSAYSRAEFAQTLSKS